MFADKEHFEVRAFNPEFEVRQTPDSSEVNLDGYAIKWGSVDDTYRGFTEEVVKGAFQYSLQNKDHDQLLFVEHRPPGLARRSVGTLALSEDDVGLKLSASIDIEDNDSKSAYIKIKRKDIQGLSVGFTVYGPNGIDEWTRDEEGNEHRRIIQIAELFEVSLTSVPVHTDTTVALRSRDEWKQTRDYPAIARAKRLLRHREIKSTGGHYHA